MTRRLILALVPAMMAATVAHAQPAAPPAGGPPAPPSAAEFKARHDAMRKQHADDLKTVLRLRADQEPALNAFLASREPKTFERKARGEQKAPLTTPQRLDEMSRRDSEMAAHRAQSQQALKTFYAALSPDQQKAFDALQRLKGPGMGGHRMKMKHDGGGRGGKMAMRRHGGPQGGPQGGPDRLQR